MGVVLFENKSDCCACGACLNVCSKSAISMKPDAEGFLYPEIDPNKCVECGVWKRVCKYKTSDLNAVESTYAVTNRDEKQIMKAASGGLFSAAASAILSDGGCVFGATLTFDSGHPDTHHIMVENKEDLWKLQGSKYVQSRIGRTYQQAKECLQHGRTVLFSGTPCQIAGLKSYLEKVYENLYTMDLICHGVPSAEFFDGYIQELNKKYRGKVTEYKFRDKTKGWGMNTAFEIVRGDKKTTIFKTAKVQSYLSLFYDCKIFRENCYSCPYASSSRVGDVTIGDYWGIENEHPELDHDPDFDKEKGISCLLINSHKGQELFELIKNQIHFVPSQFAKVAKTNGQLKAPSVMPMERNNILDINRRNGYEGVERYFSRKYRYQILLYTGYDLIPQKVRKRLKKILKR